MPDIKEIADGGSNPNFPTIEEMRESQRKGSVDKGTAEQNEAMREDCKGEPDPRY